MKKVNLIVIFCAATLFATAQKDTLPQFTAKKREGVITLNWINAFKNASQINIQRSKDSNRNFVTIHSTPNPDVKTYSYVDKTAKNDTGYYRIFILFEGSNYIFTKSKRAIEEIVVKTSKQEPTEKELTEKEQAELNGTGPVGINNKDNKAGGKIPPPTNSVPVKKAWEPSIYIYTGDDGNIVINLPDALTKKYSVTFLKEEGRPVFVIDHVKEPKLMLDKAVFLRSGWFYFELREEGKVKERNKFLITRDN
jgi:hypothetical protein